MRDLTPEEKELIVNTEITSDCFEKWEIYEYEEIKIEHFPHPYDVGEFCTYKLYPTSCFESLVKECEAVRWKYLETRNEHFWDILIHLLPNSYKVVNLCAERKDICKAKHMVPETPHYGKESRAVPCYTMGACNDCGLFLLM